MFVKYPKRIKEADVDQQKTKKWLKTVGLKPKTEGLVVASQDQSLTTRSYHYGITKADIEESVNYIIAGFQELAKRKYIHRHDKAASYLHWEYLKGTQYQDSW